MSAKPDPKVWRQAFANFKRRLLQFIKNSREIVLNIQMVMFIVIQVVFLQTILTLALKVAKGGDGITEVMVKI